MITQEIVENAKRRLKIFHTVEDEHIKNLLMQSYADIQSKCGSFDMETDEQGSELVYERTRYAYNDAVEYFDENFQSMIVNYSLLNKVYTDV